jgi:hypothetical protein
MSTAGSLTQPDASLVLDVAQASTRLTLDLLVQCAALTATTGSTRAAAEAACDLARGFGALARTLPRPT